MFTQPPPPHMNMHTYIHTYTCTYTCTHTHAHTHMHTCTHTHAHTYARTHTHMHTRRHTHTHTHKQLLLTSFHFRVRYRCRRYDVGGGGRWGLGKRVHLSTDVTHVVIRRRLEPPWGPPREHCLESLNHP